MDEQFPKLANQLYSSTPVEDGPEIVRPLLDVCAGELTNQALGIVKQLKNPDTRAELARLAAEEGEWGVLIAVMASEDRWDELWNLIRECPSFWSARILQEMNDAGWQPSEKGDQDACKQLFKLAKDFTEKPQFWQLMKWTTVKEHSDSVCGIKLTPDKKQFVTWSYDGTIGLWDLVERKLIKKLTGHTDRVIALDISPDGSLMASGSSRDDTSVRVWSLPDGKVLKVLEGHSQYVSRVKISGDGETLITLDGDGVVRMWSLPDLKRMPGLPVRGNISSINMSPDGKILVTLDQRKEIRMWSLPGCKDLGAVTVHRQYANHVYFSPDGRLIAAGLGNDVCLWSMPDGKPFRIFTGHTDHISQLYFSPDGRILASRGEDMCVRLWSIPEGELLTDVKGIPSGYNTIFHPSFDYMVTYAPRSVTVIEIRSLPDGKLLNKLKTRMGSGATFTPDGLMFIGEGHPGELRFFESELVRLVSTPVSKIRPEDLDAASDLEELQSRMSKSEKTWLELLVALRRNSGHRDT